ncbi:MAG TPA: cell surface protein SprA, partial [Saprospiraceae bacterium]|nr:cell surface protein SprA [Saprospiraceae bacterium]
TDSLGNVIQNGQGKQVAGEMDFTKLYNKSPFLAKINKTTPTRSSSGPNAAGTKQAPDPQSGKKKDKDQDKGKAQNKGKDKDQNKAKSDTLATDSLGNKVPKDSKAAKDINDKLKKDKAKADEKKPATGVSPALKAVLRPLLLVRKFRLNYGEVATTTIPGFTQSSHILGMSRGWDAPGFDFISGFQPKINRRADEDTGDWLAKARSQEWITTNAFQNNPVLQTSGKSIDSRLTLEPFNDFKIDVDFSRNLTQNFSEFFKTYHKTDESIDSIFRRSPRSVGSFTISWFSIPTLFKDDSLQINSLFKEFESNRSVVSELRGVGEHEIDGPDYSRGFGRKQQDILVPAFLAAYTGKDPENFQFTDIFDWFPRPNWQLNYNGLSKIPMFKNLFSNVRISHGYKSSLTINQFESDLSYDDYNDTLDIVVGQQNPNNLDTLTRNYYSQFLLPSVIMEEQFSPLIGIDIKFKNDMNVNFSYTKKRSLAMGFISYELAETRSTTYDLGIDWKLKDVRLGFLPGFNSQANKKKSSGAKPGTAKLGNDLSILFDLSFADNLTINHLLDQQAGARPTRGSKDISISPSISYDVNKNVNLRFFVDYRRQQ